MVFKRHSSLYTSWLNFYELALVEFMTLYFPSHVIGYGIMNISIKYLRFDEVASDCDWQMHLLHDVSSVVFAYRSSKT